jgi:hypothetical protein
MKRSFFIALLASIFCSAVAQNDLDAIRYSRVGVGGSARFVSMGGAFGALGADLSVGGLNPAGLAVFRKGDIQFSGGLKTTNTNGTIYGKSTSLVDASFVFNNFGVAAVWKSQNDPESRHVVAFSNNQVQNFFNSVRLSGYTNNNSITKDMLYQAEGKTLKDLSNSYEGLAYDAYLLDYDSASGKYFSFVDTKRTVLQTRDIVTKGRVNDLNFSYAYTHKDKFYLGASISFPQVEYTSTTTHNEYDDKDSMRVAITSDSTFTTTYTDGLPFIYTDRLGFNSLTYEEYFKTTGSGFNLKIGGIYRVNDFFRVGGFYHSPTILRLTDLYYNAITTSFDKAKSSTETTQYPDPPKSFGYRIITPSRLGVNFGFVLGKKALIGIDYETVNYRQASLSSSNVDDFKGVNTVITTKYAVGHNLRIGTEYNLEPFKIRLGYSMNGSPFGEVFSGPFVRNNYSVGFGYKSRGSFYADFVFVKSIEEETYYLYTALPTSGRIINNTTTAGVTIGFKF